MQFTHTSGWLEVKGLALRKRTVIEECHSYHAQSTTQLVNTFGDTGLQPERKVRQDVHSRVAKSPNVSRSKGGPAVQAF